MTFMHKMTVTAPDKEATEMFAFLVTNTFDLIAMSHGHQ